MIETIVPIVIVLLLVVANGLFVAAEFAIVGAPRARIEHQAAQGSRLAQRVGRILEDPRRQDRYIATTQIGISVASLGLGMYGEHVLARWISERLSYVNELRWIAVHTVASVAAVGLLTYLHIVIGEMVPKALALQRAAHTVLYVSPVIEVLELVLYQVVRVHGIARMRIFADDLAQCRGLGTNRDALQSHPRCHRFACGSIAKLEELLQDPA